MRYAKTFFVSLGFDAFGVRCCNYETEVKRLFKEFCQVFCVCSCRDGNFCDYGSRGCGAWIEGRSDSPDSKKWASSAFHRVFYHKFYCRHSIDEMASPALGRFYKKIEKEVTLLRCSGV